ncbi:hypothetical protein DPMN_153181 [Dreissena polymorpha]|uniref:Uncharacterized protein n=1 Tax=Dreissena polymorpha TaxID=45954 RepID=A0A9D4FIV4_DREPO|nr:hypothetical protein DPMN_153181 [Dreissena polymorpha]
MFMTITCHRTRSILINLVHKCSGESLLVQSFAGGQIEVPLVMSYSITVMW